ncbi:unnamed protein product [Cuscuta europaea]|uniref:Uncharacterized protein n=1 Tax=Cuscuta europaea TaxID=41803 RepID=A0A9P0Z768_CUSEU|nr:unnamed protein product [Cuscuta europaea]
MMFNLEHVGGEKGQERCSDQRSDGRESGDGGADRRRCLGSWARAVDGRLISQGHGEGGGGDQGGAGDLLHLHCEGPEGLIGNNLKNSDQKIIHRKPFFPTYSVLFIYIYFFLYRKVKARDEGLVI